MAGICFPIPLPIDPIHDKGCKARSRTLIVDNDFVLMKRFAPLWFRSLWQTNGGISGEGSTVPALLWLRDSKDPFFFVFYLDLEIFFFLQIGWINCSGVAGSICEQSCRFVSFWFESGIESFFEGKCKKLSRNSSLIHIRRGKNCVWLLGWNRFLCCNIVIMSE